MERHFLSCLRLAVTRLIAFFSAILVSSTLYAQTVSVTETDGNMSKLLSPSTTVFSTGNSSGYTIVVDPTRYYQTMDGFGASLTDSAAWLISNKLNASQQTWIMQQLFAPFSSGGISLGILRQPMGASDFAACAPDGSCNFNTVTTCSGGGCYGNACVFSPAGCTMTTTDYCASSCNYSYDDNNGQADASLSHFSIAHDQPYIIPLLKRALSYNPSLKIQALPWSAPAWMKNPPSGSSVPTMSGGSFNNGYAATYANYFVRFVQAYQAQGLPIWAVAAQNEPENNTAGYPSMFVSASDEGNFIGSYLGPAFANAGLGTKIFGYEHNWVDSYNDTSNYPETVLANSTANAYLAGSSFHCYQGGDASAQNTVKVAYPAKDIWFTECTASGRTDFSQTGDSATQSDFASALSWMASNLMIGTTRNWARGVTEWNLALNQNHGPVNGVAPNVCANCRGIMTIDTTKSPAGIYKTPEYYGLGHLSAFVQAGAQRIYSNTFGSGSIEDVAFKNPDGSTALFVLNNSGATQTFTAYWQGSSFNYSLPNQSVVTLTWPAGTPPLAGINSNAWYNVISQNSYACVDGQVASSGSSNGQPVQQWQCGRGQYNQEWQFQPTSGGYYKISNRSTGLVWDVTGGAGATAPGTKIQQWSYSGGSNQQWQPQSLGNGYYRFVALSSGLCLDISSNTANGVQLTQNTCNNARSQDFFLTQQQ